jgi:hypothetical protein
MLGAFTFNNTRLLLPSGIGEPYDANTGKGAVGRSFGYQSSAGALGFFARNQRASERAALGLRVGRGSTATALELHHRQQREADGGEARAEALHAGEHLADASAAAAAPPPDEIVAEARSKQG